MAKNKSNKKGNIYLLIYIPIVLCILLLITIVLIFRTAADAVSIMLPIAFFSIFYAIFVIVYNKKYLKSAMFNFATSATKIQTKFFKELNLAYAICEKSGNIIWANDEFFNISENFNIGKNISSYFTELKRSVLVELTNNEVFNTLSYYGDKKFNIIIKPIKANEVFEMEVGRDIFSENDELLLIYFENKTDLLNLKQNFDEEKNVIGLIYIDNYEEVVENMEDSKTAMLLAMVDRKLNRYISNNGGIIKKLEKDKYIFVTIKKAIERIVENRFSILEDIKEIISDTNVALTLSIGVGYEEKSVESNYDLARLAIDMALSRGGDQAVVRRGSNVNFYGGKSASKNTTARVRARVKALTLKEIMETKGNVLIMGHANGDLDSFGASIGISIIARNLGKKVNIVQNVLTSAVVELREQFLPLNEYKDVFITGDEALNIVNEDTLLIVVDHNTQTISDEMRLLNMVNYLVVIDHHRVQANSMSDALISYIEPSSSSTCELVSEMIRFTDDNIEITQLEALAMLAGMVMDTNNFIYHTSSKTFEAAAYLREKNADLDKVKKLLRYDLQNEIIKNDIVNNHTEYYKDVFAIAIVENHPNVETSVLTAQVANELINIKNIKASIAISKINGQFNISSRSIDEVNVQVMMEKLGGGGHRTQAGAKIEAEDFEDVKNKVKTIIDEMINEKEVE